MNNPQQIRDVYVSIDGNYFNIPPMLLDALLWLIDDGWSGLEYGGYILNKNHDDIYWGIRLENAAQSPVLYHVKPEVFASMILPQLKNGWSVLATFHAHPPNCSRASELDRATLFNCAPLHFIYSGDINDMRAYIEGKEYVCKIKY